MAPRVVPAATAMSLSEVPPTPCARNTRSAASSRLLRVARASSFERRAMSVPEYTFKPACIYSRLAPGRHERPPPHSLHLNKIMAARVPQVLASLVLPLVLAACGQGSGAPSPGAGAGAAPPPPEVGVITVATGDVGVVNELPGRLEASRVAEVRARAAGIVEQRLFREGSDVRAGQVLFRIDPAPYAAAHASAQANLTKAQANLAQAAAL